MPKTAYKAYGELMLWISDETDPPTEEWDAYLQEMEGMINNLRPKNRPYRALVITDGGAPNTIQRAATLRLGEGLVTVTAVLSTDVMARGVVTAFSWFGVKIKAFSPKNVYEAFKFLHVTDGDILPIWNEVLRLNDQLQKRTKTVTLTDPFVRSLLKPSVYL